MIFREIADLACRHVTFRPFGKKFMKKTEIKIELFAPNCALNRVLCSGSFNDWSTNSGVVELFLISPGLYQGKSFWKEVAVEYKYHLNDWDTEELDEWGSQGSNRYYNGTGTIRDFVPQFLSDRAYHNQSYLPKIEQLPANLPLPEPFATRRIAALLPHNYEASKLRYPVIYLQDGQNLFDEFAPYGNWELDKRLAWLAERGKHEFIVVAIDHAEDKRISEFSPPIENRLGKGDSDAYGRFIVDHLKPLIDRTYRTKPDRANTAIGGSSMGALASLDVSITYPQIFSKLMLLSPSIWVAPDMVENWPEHNYGPTHIFLCGGMEESPNSAATFGNLADKLSKKSTPKRPLFLKTHILSNGKHTESFWGKVFPKAASHLFP